MRGHTKMTATAELQLAEIELARARAAAAQEQREANKAAYLKAKQEGRALEEQSKAVKAQYFALDAEVRTREAALRRLAEKIDAALIENPAEIDDFASEAEMAAWERTLESMLSQRTALQAELYGLGVNLNERRMEAIKTEQAVEHFRHVVRNLRNKIDDPKLEGAVRGWEGGLSGI